MPMLESLWGGLCIAGSVRWLVHRSAPGRAMLRRETPATQNDQSILQKLGGGRNRIRDLPHALSQANF